MGYRLKNLVDVDMNDLPIWRSEQVNPHSDCWVRDSLHSQMIDCKGRIALRGGAQIENSYQVPGIDMDVHDVKQNVA